jgi:hypothetical protein
VAVYFTECPNATPGQRDLVVADATRAALKAVCVE